MAVDYTEVENAIIAKLIEKFPDELSEGRVQAGDVDKVFEAVFGEGADYGVLLEFDGGRRGSREAFKQPVWIWSIAGIFFIRYGEGIEGRLRSVVNKLAKFLDDDHTLGGVAPVVKITGIGDPEPGQVNDIAFYWLPFEIEAIDR